MNRSLFLSMLRLHGKPIISYAFGMAVYQLLFIWVYPTMTKSTAFSSLLKGLPEGLLKLMGYQSGVSQVSDFLAGEFYGLIYVIIFSIYTVTASTKFIAHLIENGSMAYLLATPVSRTKVATTQAVILALGVVVIGVICTVTGLLGVQIFVHHAGLNTSRFIELNVVGILLFLVVGAYCYLFSCLARDERTALTMSAVLTLVFFMLNMVGSLSSRVAWLQNLSIFTTFKPQELVHGAAHFASLAIVLTIVAISLFSIAIAGFRSRQMSL